MNFIIIVTCCILYAVLNSLGAAVIKKQLSYTTLNSVQDYFHILLNAKVIGGFLLIFVSALILFKALSIGKFSLIGPLSNGINFICTISIGVYFFKDKLTTYHYFGLLLILSGIFMLAVLEKQH